MNIYSTKDFYFACLLDSKGYKFLSSKRENERTIFFTFEIEDEKSFSQLLQDFINMTVETNVKKFTLAMKNMRNELNKHK